MKDHAPTDHMPDEVQPYCVTLDVFEGPLDLLLHLIEQRELDITKVSLAAVTDQYLEYIQHIERIRVEHLAEFLVVAAKLLLIKSRALLPAPPVSEAEEEEDLGEELARQLREYKKFKELARQLGQREEEGLRAYVRIAPVPEVDRELDLTDVTLDDLLAAVREALAERPPSEPAGLVVARVTISIADKIRDLEARLAQEASFSFTRMLGSAQSRTEIIVTFLALLELIKGRGVQVRQERLFGEILVFAAEEPHQPSPSQEAP